MEHDPRVVEISLSLEKRVVLLERLDRVASVLVGHERGLVDIAFTEHSKHVEVEARLDIPPEAKWISKTTLPRVAVDEETRLNLVQNRVLEELRHVALEEIEAVAVDRSDIHLS